MSGSPVVDPTNPSGALPGDPRHGLNEAQLEAYYRGQSPSWIVDAVLGSDIDKTDEMTAGHLEYLRSAREQIRFAGPTLADDGETIGSIWLIDAADRAAAEKFVAEEPYCAAGAFSSVTFTRWSSSMQTRQGEYTRTPGWKQFAITAHDRPEGQERRDAVAGAHHEFQASVMDRYVARGPMLSDDGSTMTGSFMIMEFPDRAACDNFWAQEPLNTGGVFSKVKIDPWRYGSALG